MSALVQTVFKVLSLILSKTTFECYCIVKVLEILFEFSCFTNVLRLLDLELVSAGDGENTVICVEQRFMSNETVLFT